MRNKLILPVVISFCFSLTTHAKMIANFTDYFRSPAVLMDKTHLCIWDQPERKIRVYSLKDYKKISEFGGKGQAPGEFMGISTVTMIDDKIFVSSYPKLCVFTKEGKLVKELKGPTNAGSFTPIGKNFIGTTYPYVEPDAETAKIVYSLFDSHLEKDKDVFFGETTKMIMHPEKKPVVTWYSGITKTYIYNNRIYIGSTMKGFDIYVIDQKGDRLYEIHKPFNRRRITEDDKNRRIADAKRHWGDAAWKQFISSYDISFPVFYPAFESFSIDNDRIYVFLYPEENSQAIIILDLKGNALGEKQIPILEVPGCIEAGRFSIRNGKLFYMVENDNTEMWELHVISID